MASLKQGMIAKEHLGTDLDTAVFYMDMRTPRKDFEKYYARAEDLGARLIRSRVHSIHEDEPTRDLTIRYTKESGDLQEETFDMVVLSVGGVTTPETIKLAKKLGVRLSHNRFMDTECFRPVTTSRPGIYSCGFFNGPKDIPQTVMEGSAAAMEASSILAKAKGTLIRKKEFPPEKDVSGEPARVGIFVCHCGLNIGSVADIPALVEYARDIPNVEYVQANLFTCSQDAQAQMVEMIKEHNLNRVVVAACSPSTHQPIFQDMLRTAGLNKYLFEMANIRNQCTWVHQHEPDAATEKCQDLIRMAAAKAGLLSPLDPPGLPLRAGEQKGPGGGRRRLRHDLRVGARGAGLRGAPGGAQRPPGRQCSAPAQHLAGRPGGLAASATPGHGPQSSPHHRALQGHRYRGGRGGRQLPLQAQQRRGYQPRRGDYCHRGRALSSGRAVSVQKAPQRPAVSGSGPGIH